MYPNECQGRAYHSPSASNPNQCYRCSMPIQDKASAIPYQPDLTSYDAVKEEKEHMQKTNNIGEYWDGKT